MPGLDITKAHIPAEFQPELEAENPEQRHTNFVKYFIDLTAGGCMGWKPNLKFTPGSVAMKRFEDVCQHITKNYPDHILLVDDKDGDIGNTCEVKLAYYLTQKIDALTLSPIMGYEDSMEIFLRNADLGCFLLCLTSNKGNGDILCKVIHTSPPQALYEVIAGFARDTEKWNKNKNLHLVVGATNTIEQVQKIRAQAGEDAVLLTPGLGSQKGDPGIVNAARNSKGTGIIVPVSRDLIKPERQGDESYEQAVARTLERYQEITKLPVAAN